MATRLIKTTTHLPPKLRERLDRTATQEHRSLSKLIHLMIVEGLARRGDADVLK